MGSLRTLTILLALGAWGAATEGAPPDDGMSPQTNGNRAPLPAPAVDYLKGGIRLFNTGDQATAAKYLKVANDYRDQLSPTDVVQLDSYLTRLNSAPTDAAVKPANSGASADAAPLGAAPPSTQPPIGSPRGTSDPKSEARWKLQAAKEQLKQGNFDEATRIVLEVQKMNIKWGLFEETPAKLAEAISKARPKATASAGAVVKDKKAAMARLKEAKELLANNQYEQAEVIALEVKSWGLRYGMFDETPDKVASAARALRRRDETRNAKLKDQPSLEQYQMLVGQARAYLAKGDIELADARARQAERMNVYPSGTADRAEAVLNDIAMARAKAATPTTIAANATPSASMPATAPAMNRAPVVETPSLIAEREANKLLSEGKTKEASDKFVEADRLRASEMSQPSALVASNPAPKPVVDGSVQQVATKPDPAPAVAPPTVAPVVVEAGLPNLDPPVQTAPQPTQAQAPAQAPVGLPALGGPEAAPAPIADPASPPAAMPVPEAAPLISAPPSLSSDVPPAGNKGEELLSQARSLFTSGNYAAARAKAAEARDGNFGVNAQADEMLAQIGLSEQGGALAVYEAALDAIRKGDVEKARALLTEVAASSASLDEGMVQKVQDLLMKLPKQATNGKAIASDVPVNDAETLRAQQMNAEVGSKVAEARRMMEVDPDKAMTLLQTTLTAVKAAELPPAVSRTMVRRLEVAIELSKADKVKFDARMQDKDAKAEIEVKKLRILEADKVKKAALKDLMTKAETAYANGDLAKAEELARRAQEIDPNEVAPQMLAFKSNMERHYKQDLETKRLKEEGFLGEMQDVDKAMIIPNDVVRGGISYPKNFKELSERRKKMQLSDTRQRSMQELAIEKKLNEPITLNLRDQTLDEAIAFISNYTGLNVIVDAKALNEEGLTRDSKVNLTANSIKLKSALKFLLNPLGLTYKADDDVLLITSPQASRDKTYTWTYPVADLVVPPTKSTGNGAPSGYPSINGLEPVATGSGMGTQNGQASQGWSQIQRTVTIADMMPLVQLITTTIAPNTWQVAYPDSDQNAYGMGAGFGAGGNDAPAQPGSITPFLLSISLIIRHTAEVHEEVAELLKQLRRLQDLQVSIEVRFITVSDDFFEQIGVDFDFAIQSNAVGKGTSFAAPSGSAQAASYPFSLVSGTTSGTGGTTGGTAGTTTGGTTGTGGGTTGATGTTTGGTGGGATAGGAVSGGGFAGGGGGIGGAGNFGGGGTGTAGGTAGGTTTTGSTSGTSVGYIVNPFLDNSLGRKTPVVVGTAAGGIGNYTNNLNIPFTQGSAANIQPFNSIPSAGATFGISFLSDLEMYLFLTAAQGDARNNIVQAPKVTTFNGANATITNAEVQYYISQLTPIIGPAAVSFLPTPAPLNDGVTLSVTPVVSADRRYVRLSLAPFFQTIDGLQSFPVPAAVGSTGFGTGTAIMGQIQLPQTTTTNINTTVTVPDGGTVLLGGVKRMREQRLEYGVPVLSKTPLINRLFRNIGIGRRTDSLMLMVTPRIIILEEEEDRLGVRTINANP